MWWQLTDLSVILVILHFVLVVVDSQRGRQLFGIRDVHVSGAENLDHVPGDDHGDTVGGDHRRRANSARGAMQLDHAARTEQHR